MSKSIKILLNYFLGPALFCWLAWGIYQQVLQQKDLQQQLIALRGMVDAWGLLLISVTFFLMLIQWLLEARKWQQLMEGTYAVTTSASFMSVFRGITFSMATPYRLGEFTGRVIYLPSGTRIQGALFTFVGNFAQLTVTCVAGCIALFSAREKMYSVLATYHLHYVLDIMLLGSLMIGLFMLFLFFGSTKIVALVKRLPWFKRYEKQIKQLGSIPRSTITYLLFLSSIRFLIFILQYWILLKLAGVEIDLTMVIERVSILFLCLAFLPVFSLIDLGLRWQFSLLLFKDLSENFLGISLAVTGVWFINLIIPAVIGTFSIINFKYQRRRATIKP